MAGQITEGTALSWQGGLLFNNSNFGSVRGGRGYTTLENFRWCLRGTEKSIVCHGSHFFLISTAVKLIWLQKFIQVEQLIAAHCPSFSSEHGRYNVPDTNRGI